MDAGRERRRRLEQHRYHLGRGRRAREAGRFAAGAAEARRAAALRPDDPWALALLGQCLFRQQPADLAGARAALQQAWTLAPANGYFVRLLLEVLDAQADAKARQELLTWAWWSGAPVERWLPDGPPRPSRRSTDATDVQVDDQRPAPAPEPRRPETGGYRLSVPVRRAVGA